MKGSGVSKQAFRFVWEQRLRESTLSTKARHIGHLMATYAAADGSRVYPGLGRLAHGSGMSNRTVQGAVKELRDLGWIDRVRLGNSRRGQADEYRLSLPVDHVTPPAPQTPDPWAGIESTTGGASLRQPTPPTEISPKEDPWAGIETQAPWGPGVAAPLPSSTTTRDDPWAGL